MVRIARTFWLAFVCCLAAGPEIAVAEDVERFRAADTSSPRATLKSFIEACNELHELITTSPQYYDRADPDHIALSERVLDTIDDSELSAFAREDRTAEAAVAIKEILDRVRLPPWNEIPGAQEIAARGGLEKLTDYRLPGTRITISRVEKGRRRHEYLFSPGTVERAIRYFQRIEARPYRSEGPPVSKDFYRWYLSAPGHPALALFVERLPEDLRLGRTLGLANWKWPGLLVALVIALTLVTLAYRSYVVLGNRVREEGLVRYWLPKYWLTMVFPIAAMLIPLAFEHVAYRHLTVRSRPLYVVGFASTLAALLASLVVIFGVGSRIAASVIASPNINPAGLNAQLIRITARLASVLGGVIVFIVGGQYLGIPVATLLTSAGIGGVALALGAQDTLKTLFGTISLLSDKPFRAGERIVFRDYDGIVEDIGLRSTKLRLLDGKQVTLPNDMLASNDVANVARRPYIRRVGEIHIPLDTPCERVERAVAILRDELHEHEGMDPDRPPRVFFREFAPGAFSIQFIYWYAPPHRWKFLAFNEKLNFNVFRRFEAEGIQFSLPFRHSFWKHDDEQGPIDVNLVGDDSLRERES